MTVDSPPGPSPLTQRTLQDAASVLARQDIAELQRLNAATIRLNRWRQQLLVNTFRSHHGATVFAGPFAGMQLEQAAEGCLMPKLLGCYEAELHPHIMAARHAGYEAVLDIGCAEGYYAVGLARLLTDCHIHAHDIAMHAQTACRSLAALNGVADRVEVGGVVAGEDFARFADRKTLLFCDIEGGETALLDPEKYPALRRMDLMVEVHECFQPGLVAEMQRRFSGSHHIEWVWQSLSVPRAMPEWVSRLSHLDQILCSWEWRAGPTPWAIMTAKA